MFVHFTSDKMYLLAWKKKRLIVVCLSVSPKHLLHGQLTAFDFEVGLNLFQWQLQLQFCHQHLGNVINVCTHKVTTSYPCIG